LLCEPAEVTSDFQDTQKKAILLKTQKK